MLELAVCLPVFALLILGTAEIANIAWASIQLNNAAHAGAQYGSHSRGFAADTAHIEAATQAEAPTLTITFPTAPAQTCSCIDPSTGAPATTNTTGCQTLIECPSPYVIMDSITVTTQAVVTPLIHYPLLPASYTLHAQATMGVVN
jgi:Flp pilus assembly protein TadG